MKILQTTLVSLVALSWSANAQTTTAPDTSGNNQLQGTYYVRYVAYYVSDAAGTLSREVSLNGQITFSGNGAYTLAGSLLDSTASPVAAQTYMMSGTYGISASGLGTISGLISGTDLVYGLVSNGIFIGSSTESNFNDLLIAAPAGTTAATAATFTGTYSMTSFGFPSTDASAATSAWFQVAADGVGSLGAVTLNGHSAASATTIATQSLSSVGYTFAGGVGTIAFPAVAGNFVSGNEILYISPDGNFVFGGSATGWDVLVGVRAASGTPPPTAMADGLLYQAGLDEDVSDLGNGVVTLAGYYGSLNTGGGKSIGHQRLGSLPVGIPYDYTYEDTFTLNADGTYSDPLLQASYVVGANGIRIGYDTAAALGINIALPAPALTGAGVFLNPEGVVNAASFAPFTAGISPGEFISLFGTNLAATTTSATVFPVPTTLGNTQVLVNGTPAPVTYASPTLISAIVPYTVTGSSTTPGTVQVQVVNNGTSSNSVTTYLKTTSPGVFTVPAGGLGYGAVLHLDYSLMTAANPAQVGETLAVFVSGLGQVTPAIITGNAGPTGTYSLASNEIAVLVDAQLAAVSYAGLAPGFAGLYQINFTVPSGVHSGDVYLGVSGPDSLSAQSRLSIAAGTGTLPTGAQVTK